MKLIPLALAVTFLSFAPAARAETVDGIAAIVNDEVITLSQLNELKMPVGRQGFINYAETDDPQVRRRLLDKLIEKKLQIQRAHSLGITVSEADVDGAIADVRSRNDMDQQELAESLREQGLTMADYRQQIREQITIARLVHHEVRSRIVVNDQDALEYYNRHPELFGAAERREICRIFFAYDPAWDETRKARAKDRIAAAIEQIKRGVPFTDVARAFSEGPNAGQGGLLGRFRDGELQPVLNRYAFGLKEHEVSELIRTADGYNLVYVRKVEEGEARPFVDVEDDIILQLQSDRMSDYYNEWMEELRAKAYVEIKI
ncbi:MAG: SurA N-terminal domain-containing protein [Nitrospirota bacterium]|jgi:peptidyl-prolyl cis-trans isomerase SurA